MSAECKEWTSDALLLGIEKYIAIAKRIWGKQIPKTKKDGDGEYQFSLLTAAIQYVIAFSRSAPL